MAVDQYLEEEKITKTKVESPLGKIAKKVAPIVGGAIAIIAPLGLSKETGGPLYAMFNEALKGNLHTAAADASQIFQTSEVLLIGAGIGAFVGSYVVGELANRITQKTIITTEVTREDLAGEVIGKLNPKNK